MARNPVHDRKLGEVERAYTLDAGGIDAELARIRSALVVRVDADDLGAPLDLAVQPRIWRSGPTGAWMRWKLLGLAAGTGLLIFMLVAPVLTIRVTVDMRPDFLRLLPMRFRRSEVGRSLLVT